MSCGLALSGASETDQSIHARLSASAPTPLIDKMRAARITGERKPVTALFADVVGSTTLAEQMDAEDWTAIISEIFDLMSNSIFRYEGTIAQLQGDAILAFFGAPVAHEDDPERAVRAALDMVTETDEFARQLKVTHGIDLRIRAGINSGPVVVGNVGTDLRYEYTALGDAMNVASRMQAAAEPGQVVITANTQRLVASAFESQDLGLIAVKGKAEPVHAYRVISVKDAPQRARGLEQIGLESPMVGRGGQLETLTSLFDAVRGGRGAIAVVVGEPGIGKSRLLAEFRAWTTAAAAAADGGREAWIEGRSVSYGRNLPYHLLLDLVHSIVDIPFATDEAEARAILDRTTADLLGDDAAEAAGYLAHLLGLSLRADEVIRAQIDPEVMQNRYVAAIHRVLSARAAQTPLIVVCEDVHWADVASADVVRQLIPLAMQQRILLVLALRMETDSAGWGLVEHAREFLGGGMTEIHLEPLSDADSRDLVANLLAIESLPDRVRDLILARAEGNPFFVEEVVRMLIDRGVIERRGDRWVATAAIESVEIPETLHGLLLARIDQLAPDVKRSLRVASVIGRQFAVRVLDRVLGETVS